MELTKKDVPICKMIFTESTHEMGMLMYGERAKEIYGFVCNTVLGRYDIHEILTRCPVAEKIWDSGKLDPYLHKMDKLDVQWTLMYSPIADNIYFSKKIPYNGKIPFNVYTCLIKRKLRKIFSLLALNWC